MPDSTPTDAIMRDRIRAGWLCGIIAACITTGHWPRWIDRAEALRLHVTAGEVAFGPGAFNPLLIWEMRGLVSKTIAALEAETKGKAVQHD